MTDPREPDDGASGGADGSADAIARLLRAAGPRPAAPAERAERVRASVHRHWRSTLPARRWTRWLAWSAVPLAAALAWAFLLTPAPGAPVGTLERSAGAVSWGSGAVPMAGAPLDAGSLLETGADGRVAVRLAGGASVRLDGDSRARLIGPGTIGLERGGVYVDTGREAAGAALVVRTFLGDVRDIGTQFQVRATDGAVRLSVREGAAVLEGSGAAHEAASGTRLTLEADGRVTREAVAVSGPDWDWVEDAAPPFELEGRRLADYLDWVARETGLVIEPADPTIAADAGVIVLHGSVEGLRPSATLEAVLPTCGLQHRIDGRLLIIERAGGREPAAAGP